jgi:hypothetical protein
VKEGEAFELQGVATDAAPSEMPQEREGRSVSRRITIVSTDEMQRELAAVERTLADELSPLSEAVERDLGQLREARAAWRGARELTPEGLDALRQQADAAEAIHRRLASTGGWLERLTNLREAHEWNNLQPEESQRLRDIEELVSQAASESQPGLSNSLREAIRTAEATSAAQEKKQRIVPNSEEAAAIDDALAQAESAARQSGQTLASAADQLDQRSHQLDLREALERIASEQSTLRADTVAAGNEVLAKAVADVTPQERGAVARLAERQRQILESFDRAAAHASSPSSEEGQSASENSSMPEALDSTAIAGLMNRSAGALDDFNIGDAMQAQQSLDDLLNTIRDQMKSAGDSSDQLMKDLEDADQLLKSLTKSEEEWIDAAESLSSIPSSDATLREALLQMKKQQEQSAQTMRDLTKRLRKSAPQAASTASDAAELLNRSAERLEDSEVPESVTEARRALEKLERAAEEVGREKSRANLQKQLVAYEQSRTVALALAERQSRLREETVRLEELTKDGGRLSRSQRRTLRQLADDQQSLAKDVSQASGEAPDDVARLAFDVAAATMQSAAEQLASEKVGVEVQQPQSDAERQLRMIASALAMEPPPQSSHSDAKPPEGQEGDSGEMVWLAPQIELLKQMQLDLIERTTRGTAPESPAASESEQAKLQADQQRLAELAAQILSSLVNDEEPPAVQNEIPPGLDEMESMP